MVDDASGKASLPQQQSLNAKSQKHRAAQSLHVYLSKPQRMTRLKITEYVLLPMGAG
jgi:hypothetical protein